MSMCSVFSCVDERGCLLWLMRSLGKTLLAFALLHSMNQGKLEVVEQEMARVNIDTLGVSELKWSSELNSPILVHFSLLIPRMSVFTLAISCLTTSNLPWFMDLTFQVPMQYCCLQHWTLLLSPVTSTTGCCFCFGFVSSFFLYLFLHWSPAAY